MCDCRGLTRVGLGRAEAHGTCWHECHCDGAGTCMYSDNECADFTCDNGKWRRQGQQDMCVLDTCTKVGLSVGLLGLTKPGCGVLLRV